ncbi:MAG: peptidoglycan-binding protein [Geminicoccaceae bacterium]
MGPVLRRGMQGGEVEGLQRALAARGFRPGAIDGRFGPGTEAALIAFQRAHGLLPDGIFGPITRAKLEGDGAVQPADVTGRIDLELVSAMFPYTRLDSIALHLPVVLAALRQLGLVDKPMVLMALATIRAETETFEPVDELPSRFNTSPGGHAFDLYDQRADLGNRGRPDGDRYKGRGFVQLTGRANYRRIGQMIGLADMLERNPERAALPGEAARVLAAFLASRRRPIKEALLEHDLGRARRLVNGGRHGLDRFAEAYRIGDALVADEVWRCPAPAAGLSYAAA